MWRFVLGVQFAHSSTLSAQSHEVGTFGFLSRLSAIVR
jgi:hypothetical protein